MSDSTTTTLLLRFIAPIIFCCPIALNCEEAKEGVDAEDDDC